MIIGSLALFLVNRLGNVALPPAGPATSVPPAASAESRDTPPAMAEREPAPGKPGAPAGAGASGKPSAPAEPPAPRATRDPAAVAVPEPAPPRLRDRRPTDEERALARARARLDVPGGSVTGPPITAELPPSAPVPGTRGAKIHILIATYGDPPDAPDASRASCAFVRDSCGGAVYCSFIVSPDLCPEPGPAAKEAKRNMQIFFGCYWGEVRPDPFLGPVTMVTAFDGEAMGFSCAPGR